MKLRHSVIFGGVGQKPQTDAIQRGVDILTATPGRLLDLMQQGFISLRDLDIFVLDEADRMLDMGFIHDVRKVIAKLPTERQTLFFSATMPPEIQKLANTILTDPIKVEVTPVSSTAETVEQVVYFAEKREKRSLLVSLLQNPDIKSVLVFTRTKHGANKVAKDLTKAGIRAEAIHGNKSQTARQLALSNFKSGKNRALVATDIAARGIDIDELSHVLNYELPNIPETYVHRIGRTGRAGASGQAISFCDAEERAFLRDIEKLIGKKVPTAEYDGPWIEVGAEAPDERPQRPQRNQPQRPQSQNRPQQQPPAPRPQQAPKPAPQPRQEPAMREANGSGESASAKRRNRRNRNRSQNDQMEPRQQQQGNGRPERQQMQNEQRPQQDRPQQQRPQQDRPQQQQRPQQDRPQQQDRSNQQQGGQPRPQQPNQRNQQGGGQQKQNLQFDRGAQDRQQRPMKQQGKPVPNQNSPKPAQTEKKNTDWDDLDLFNW
jgi:ATP-dependent RNA helicase RhlE